MPESNIRATARLINGLDEIEKLILNEVLPAAAYLKLPVANGLWSLLEETGTATREFLNNHNAVIEPLKRD